MKPYLITTVAAFLTLFLGVSAQGVLLNDYTTLDVPGATDTFLIGIDGSNIVGYYEEDGNVHGFLATIPEPTTLSLLAVGLLMACRRRR